MCIVHAYSVVFHCMHNIMLLVNIIWGCAYVRVDIIVSFLQCSLDGSPWPICVTHVVWLFEGSLWLVQVLECSTLNMGGSLVVTQSHMLKCWAGIPSSCSVASETTSPEPISFIPNHPNHKQDLASSSVYHPPLSIPVHSEPNTCIRQLWKCRGNPMFLLDITLLQCCVMIFLCGKSINFQAMIKPSTENLPFIDWAAFIPYTPCAVMNCNSQHVHQYIIIIIIIGSNKRVAYQASPSYLLLPQIRTNFSISASRRPLLSFWAFKSPSKGTYWSPGSSTQDMSTLSGVILDWSLPSGHRLLIPSYQAQMVHFWHFAVECIYINSHSIHAIMNH